MRRSIVLATVVAAALALPAVAGGPPAIPARPNAPAAPGGGVLGERREELRARVQEKIRTYLTTELSTRMGLDAAKSAKLADAVKAHMERKQGRGKKLHEEMQKLRGLVDAKAPDAQVKAQLDVVLGASSRDDDIQAFVADTSKFLTVQEQAKLALALPEILKDVHKMMREARQGMRGGRGFGGGRDGKPGDED